MFGDVPLFTEKRLGVSIRCKIIKRSPKADVYKQIEADLNQRHQPFYQPLYNRKKAALPNMPRRLC
jgi:hypothetical protein